LEITITKRIAKQGTNLVLIIPKHLHPYLSQGDIVKVQMNRLDAEVKK
jgi:hypothetical protein